MTTMPISGLTGFDQTQYDQLIQEARKRSVDVDVVNKKLVEAVTAGKLSFSDAVKSVTGELPTLPPPLTDGSWLTDSIAFGAELPSPGAMMLALIGDVAEEQRKGARDVRNLKTEQVISEMKNQAKNIREQGRMQLIMGCIAGGLQMGQGILSLGMLCSGTKDLKVQLETDKMQNPSTAFSNYQAGSTALNTKIGAWNSIFGGTIAFVQAGDKYMSAGYEAERKEMDARIEAMRAFQDAMKDLEDKMKDLAAKSRDAATAIQHSTTEARRNIMKA